MHAPTRVHAPIPPRHPPTPPIMICLRLHIHPCLRLPPGVGQHDAPAGDAGAQPLSGAWPPALGRNPDPKPNPNPNPSQVYSLSAERGELLSGARDAYLQYIGRLEARLRERELAVVDEKLVRSERQRFEAEANLAQVRVG